MGLIVGDHANCGRLLVGGNLEGRMSITAKEYASVAGSLTTDGDDIHCTELFVGGDLRAGIWSKNAFVGGDIESPAMVLVDGSVKPVTSREQILERIFSEAPNRISGRWAWSYRIGRSDIERLQGCEVFSSVIIAGGLGDVTIPRSFQVKTLLVEACKYREIFVATPTSRSGVR